MDFPIQNCYFPWLCESIPEGIRKPTPTSSRHGEFLRLSSLGTVGHPVTCGEPCLSAWNEGGNRRDFFSAEKSWRFIVKEISQKLVFSTRLVFSVWVAQDMFFVENQHGSSATMNVLNIRL